MLNSFISVTSVAGDKPAVQVQTGPETKIFSPEEVSAMVSIIIMYRIVYIFEVHTFS